MLEADDLLNSDDDEFLLEASNCQLEDYYLNDSKSILSNKVENEKNLNSISEETATSNGCPLNHIPAYTSSVTNITTSLNEINSPLCKRNHLAATVDNSIDTDSHFTSGFSSQIKKRKLPGPAGLLPEVLRELNSEKSLNDSHNLSRFDIEYLGAPSSQFCSENLSSLSWKNLQATMSSSKQLQAAAKYSVQRVLHESSKKKPPKYMVVPVLCVLLKKLSIEDSSDVSIFMDGTGDIKGKIDPEILSVHKRYLVEGSAIILKNVTFLCNMLILKPETVVAIYHPDGSEKNLQKLESILEATATLKDMQLKSKLDLYSGSPNNHRTSCVNNIKIKHSGLNNLQVANNDPNKLQVANKINQAENASCHKSPVKHSEIEPNEIRTDAFLEELLSEDNFMDDFDEILGNLDEKSFGSM